MRHWKKILAFLLAAVLLTGCGTAVPDTTASPAEPEQNQRPSAEEMLYESLFDSENKVEFEIKMSNSELLKLQQDYETYSAKGSKSPIYRMADLVVTITAPDGTKTVQTVEQVGVRMKGNTSRTAFYNEKEGIYNLIHLKLNFRETFDEEAYYGDDALVWDKESREARKNRTFATLEKLDLRWNKCNDATYIREHYAFEMFRQNGVLAPNSTPASVNWAGTHCGVFTAIEPVDKVFLKRNLPKNMQGGDLYKCGWTNRGADFCTDLSVGIEDEDEGLFYTYDLKTNKKKSDHQDLKDFIAALNGDMTKERFAELVNIDNFLSFAAVAYLLGNPDDARQNYNNFYIYFPPEGGALLIPTDYDRCLGLTHEWDPTGNGVTADNPFATERAAQGQQESPLWLYSVCKGGYYVGEFAEKLMSLAASQWVRAENFQKVFTRAQNLYGGLTMPGKKFYNCADHCTTMTLNGEDGNRKVSEYWEKKLETLENALKTVDTSARPNIPVPFFVRADFTNWEVRAQWALTRSDGTYRIALSGGVLKIYDRRTDRWYGSECLSENTAVSWETDEMTNIILAEGQYLLTFDPNSKTITVTGADKGGQNGSF